MEFLQLCWGFVCSTAVSLWSFVESVVLFIWELLVVLHVEHPRIEGLVVGVGLAWLLSRRDNHPLLRAASSPLKLILDILDLAWDQAVEFLGDVWETTTGWVGGVWSWCKSRATGSWLWMMDGLKSIREKLRKKEKE